MVLVTGDARRSRSARGGGVTAHAVVAPGHEDVGGCRTAPRRTVACFAVDVAVRAVCELRVLQPADADHRLCRGELAVHTSQLVAERALGLDDLFRVENRALVG